MSQLPRAKWTCYVIPGEVPFALDMSKSPETIDNSALTNWGGHPRLAKPLRGVQSWHWLLWFDAEHVIELPALWVALG